MLKAAVYARYSSDKQNEQSIEGQMRACKKYAQENKLTIVEEYVDRAMSGTNDSRPSFQKMIKDSYTNKWDCILVYKLDRFSRNKYESAKHKHTLKTNNKKLISVMENIPDSPEGIILESLLEGMNEYYSAELAQKVKRGCKESWLKGLYTAGKPPFGYGIKDHKLFVDENDAKIINKIFTLIIGGATYREVSYILNTNGLLYKDRKFTTKTVENIFNNIHYSGRFTYEGVDYPDVYPIIIPVDVYDKAHANRVSKPKSQIYTSNKSYEKSIYLLMPKVYCGICKKRFTTESGKGHKGDLYHYYRCKEKGCPGHRYRKEQLEDLVFRAIKNQLKKERVVNKIAEMLYNKHQELSYDNPQIYDLLEENEKLQQAVTAFTKSFEITSDTSILDKINKFNAKIENNKLKIEKLKNKEFEEISEKDMKDYLSYIIKNPEKDTEEWRRKIQKHYIEHVIVYPKKIAIILRGFSPVFSQNLLGPNFENIDKCLTFRGKPPEGIKNSGEAPTLRYTRTLIGNNVYLFSCSNFGILLDKHYIFKYSTEFYCKYLAQ